MGYISVAQSLGISSTAFTQCVLVATEFGEITPFKSFKVTNFGTSRKLMYDFLLVIDTDLPPILHHFRDIAFSRSKISIFRYSSCV